MGRIKVRAHRTVQRACPRWVGRSLTAGVLLFGCMGAAGQGDWFDAVSKRLHSFWYAKELVIAGLSRVAESEVRSLLPVDRSVPWWHGNLSTIAAQLSSLPGIQSASVERCHGALAYRCFLVTVVERMPAYATILGGEGWILGKDGGFVKPLPNVRTGDDLFQFVEHAPEPLIGIEGLDVPQQSLSLVAGRIHYIGELLAIIQGETSHEVQRVALSANGEAQVYLRDLPFAVTFGFGGDNRDQLKEEAQRFKMLLPKLTDRLDIIESVDLAFQKVAVVKLKHAERAARPSDKLSKRK